MKKLWLTVLEGKDAHTARTILATCDRKVIEKVALELNIRLASPSPKKPATKKAETTEELS